MTSERPDLSMMIGLHKLAANSGDGLVPELYELLLSRARYFDANPTVAEFPAWETRRPGTVPAGLEKPATDNIVAFPAARAVRADWKA
ncbi:hypothetical protein [Pararhizobium sp.]|uniref:hypothetical protein n=1 Tax=Pararhizobium sp. TaxID=1977563 RepID=UPI00271F5DB0|nr:hypothetical protein [Pararhizobium sp.]MDO9414963.1 hypothetical protein [Pararhizobium sp.]